MPDVSADRLSDIIKRKGDKLMRHTISKLFAVLFCAAMLLPLTGCSKSILYDKNDTNNDVHIVQAKSVKPAPGTWKKKDEAKGQTYVVYADSSFRYPVCTITTDKNPGIADNMSGNMVERVIYSGITTDSGKEDVDTVTVDGGTVIVAYKSGAVESYTGGCVILK